MTKQLLSPQEATKNVVDPAKKNSSYGKLPVGSAQKKVLTALGLQANNHAHAKELFKACGIVVTGTSRGVPIVWKNTPYSGSMVNEFGEGQESYDDKVNVDLSALAEWMSE